MYGNVKSNVKFCCGRADILEFELQKSFCRTKYVLPVCALEKVRDLTMKFLQRSHLVLSQVKHPAGGTSTD